MIETEQTRDHAQASMLPAQPAPLTALAHALALPGAPLATVRGARSFALFSDAADELSALTASAAVFDQGARVRLRITGQDRVRWLNGMVTNNVKALASGTHHYTFLLNAQGRIQGDATLLALDDHLVLETDASQAAHLFAHLDRFIIMDDVELAWSPSTTALGLAGPHASALLAALDLPTPAPGSATGSVLAEAAASVPRYTLWLDAAAVAPTWQRLLAAGATPAGAHAVETLRILEATPLYGVDISDKTLAQETGQDRALHFNKGCYLGQEIVERIRSRATVHRGIRQLALQGEPALPGAPITLASTGAAIGELTSVASPGTGSGLPPQVALATLRTDALAQPGALHYPGGTAHLLSAPPLRAAP